MKPSNGYSFVSYRSRGRTIRIRVPFDAELMLAALREEIDKNDVTIIGTNAAQSRELRPGP